MSTTVKKVNLSALLKSSGVIKEATHKVPVLFSEDGAPIAGFIIVGPNSEQLQDHERKLRISNISKASARKTVIDAATEEGATLVVDNLTEGDHTRALAVIVGWYGFGETEDSNEDVPFDEEVTAQLLRDLPMWQKRVLAALEVEQNFMKI